MSVPRAVAFDLDGCLWEPEMYELWGGGGSPFAKKDNGDLVDKAGNTVMLIGDARSILTQLATDDKFKNTHVATASSCDEPEWAHECLGKIELGQGRIMGSVFRSHEIYKATSKQVHLKKICSDANCNPEDVIFFDNQMNNCKAVVKLGVTTVFTGTSGVTTQIWQAALQKFPAPGSILKL